MTDSPPPTGPQRQLPPVPPMPAALTEPMQPTRRAEPIGPMEPTGPTTRAEPTGPSDLSTAELATAAGIDWNPPPLPSGTHPATGPWHPVSAAPRRRVAGAALVVAIVSLAGSLVFGWVLPLAIVAVVLASIALSRRWERRGVAGWALALSALAVLYCSGWIVWTLFALGILG